MFFSCEEGDIWCGGGRCGEARPVFETRRDTAVVGFYRMTIDFAWIFVMFRGALGKLITREW